MNFPIHELPYGKNSVVFQAVEFVPNPGALPGEPPLKMGATSTMEVQLELSPSGHVRMAVHEGTLYWSRVDPRLDWQQDDMLMAHTMMNRYWGQP